MGAKEIGSRIKEALQKTGIKQKDFAEEVGISPQSLNRWIRGDRTPSPEYITRMAEALLTSADWLLSGIGGSFEGEEQLYQEMKQRRAGEFGGGKYPRQDVTQWVHVPNAIGESEPLERVHIPVDFPGAKNIVKIKMKNNDFIPVAEKGDVVLIDTGIDKKNLEHHKEYIVKIDKQFVIAYAEHIKTVGTILHPRSPSIEPMRLSAKCNIIGRVRRIVRDF